MLLPAEQIRTSRRPFGSEASKKATNFYCFYYRSFGAIKTKLKQSPIPSAKLPHLAFFELEEIRCFHKKSAADESKRLSFFSYFSINNDDDSADAEQTTFSPTPIQRENAHNPRQVRVMIQ
jgi:hypothetical protein